MFSSCFISQNLTHLNLTWPNHGTAICDSFYSQVGECCPKLTNLTLGGVLVCPDDAIALLLGRRAHLFPYVTSLKRFAHGITRNNLHQIQIANEHLAPFCLSLEHLEFRIKSESISPGYKDPNYDMNRYNRNVTRYHTSLLGFILRHLPRLQTSAVSSKNYFFCCCHVITLLYIELVAVHSPPLLTRVHQVNGSAGVRLKWTTNSPPSKKATSTTILPLFLTL